MNNAVAKPGSKVIAFILVVLIFVAIGPLIGSLSLWLGSNFSALSRGNVGIDQFFNGFLFVLVFGYFLGFAFALISGIVVAAAGLWMRWNNFLVPIIAAAIATLAGFVLLPAVMNITMADVGTHWLFLLCLSGAFVCWLLTIRIVRRTWQSV
ncbi:MAG: hypothetical protein IPK23_13125 [Rhizobiales bacterium]|nr:hypothetical protein [Hyphomicrobiales bacterium]